MNYYYEQAFILIKRHVTMDLTWDCNEGMNKWVFIFSIKMNIPAVRAPMWACV